MRILFIAAGPIAWGSSRMRAYWVAEELQNQGHEVWILTIQEALADASHLNNVEAVIWQKVVDIKLLRLIDAVHYWDVCDPSWWWQPEACREIANSVHGVVASSPTLAKDFNAWHGQGKAICIPDRLKLSHFHTQRKHVDASPVRLIWFGIHVNRIALYAALANLERLSANGHRVELTIMDDRPDLPFKISNHFPIYHVQWQLHKEVEILASHDIALLPPYPGPWGHVKSDNKARTASMCGLPEWDGEEYERGESLLDHYNRQYVNELDKGLDSVALSAGHWESLLC